MLTSTTSKWGLNREVRATLLRVRTRPECLEGNLRELTWDSNLNCTIDREMMEKEKRASENYPPQSPNLRHCPHRTKDGANTRGEKAGCGPAHPPPETSRREVGEGSQSQKGVISAPGRASPTKLRTGFQFLTKTSWDSGRLTSTGRVTARDQLPRSWNTLHPGDRRALKTERLGPGWW